MRHQAVFIHGHMIISGISHKTATRGKSHVLVGIHLHADTGSDSAISQTISLAGAPASDADTGLLKNKGDSIRGARTRVEEMKFIG